MDHHSDVIGTAKASPTKAFFVKMLTRDIELQDALLDLLDNCVDGILRADPPDLANPRPYAGYRATISLDGSSFSIEDNCGGIPFAVARDRAFAMGRPTDIEGLAQAATVGMYGIGMKRAIFKIGTEALVESLSDRGFYVEFDSKWMQDPEWTDLPMHELPDGALPGKGTRVHVTELDTDVASAFASTAWVDEFRKIVARHYAIIIEKGLEVRIGAPEEIAKGADPVTPAEFNLLTSTIEDGAQGIQPYIFRGSIDDVEVEVYAGMYRRLLTESELDADENTKGNTDEAGWTIACNDRVVVWKDKSRLTGWGEATVPSYHGQFIAITGIVLLKSKNPRALPLTTTKRGLDAGSSLYLQVKELMRDVTKNLTTFTNKWKKFPRDLHSLYKQTEYVNLDGLRAIGANHLTSHSRKLSGIKKNSPKYPFPVQESTGTRITFTVEKEDARTLGDAYFGEQPYKPSDVGLQAFRNALEALTGKNQ
jgi:hypothetical protein